MRRLGDHPQSLFRVFLPIVNKYCEGKEYETTSKQLVGAFILILVTAYLLYNGSAS